MPKKVLKQQLHALVDRIARVGTFDLEDNDDCIELAEQATHQLNLFIEESRELLGLSFCDDCGDETEDGMNCPDGAFICQACFDAGNH